MQYFFCKSQNIENQRITKKLLLFYCIFIQFVTVKFIKIMYETYYKFIKQSDWQNFYPALILFSPNFIRLAG